MTTLYQLELVPQQIVPDGRDDVAVVFQGNLYPFNNLASARNSLHAELERAHAYTIISSLTAEQLSEVVRRLHEGRSTLE